MIIVRIILQQSVVFFLAIYAAFSAANAAGRVCNKAPFDVHVAIGYDDASLGVEQKKIKTKGASVTEYDQYRQRIRGWYQIKSGTCGIVLSSENQKHIAGKVAKVIRFIAQGHYKGKQVYWRHANLTIKSCVHPTKAFDYILDGYSCSHDGAKDILGRFVIGVPDKADFTMELSYNSNASIRTALNLYKTKGRRNNKSPSYDSGKAALTFIGIIAAAGLTAAALERMEEAEEEDCMRQCTKSKARCLELCTQ